MSVALPTSSSSGAIWDPPPNTGTALFITFAVLFILSVWDVTSKFALWIAIALAAIVWADAFSSGRAKEFWQALSS